MITGDTSHGTYVRLLIPYAYPTFGMGTFLTIITACGPEIKARLLKCVQRIRWPRRMALSYAATFPKGGIHANGET